MSYISTIEHYVASATSQGRVTDFYNNLGQSINRMQGQNLEVEIQYQQSNGIVSALIIGREKQN